MFDNNTWSHLTVQIELLVLDNNSWSYLTACKVMSSGSFKNNVTYKVFFYKSYIYLIYIYIYV